MRTLSAGQAKGLQAKLGQRVNLDPIERQLYSHDLGVIPGLVKPLVGNTLPHAIVQPADEAEVVSLVQWATAEGVPLVPRGKATSGYGGVLPVKGGLVVDFRRMSRVLAVDPEALTATVQPGIVWRFLDAELQKRGLTLRLYPTSYPSSTVGGWLAQGGAGLGSFASGWFRDNVLSARVVLPDGTVKTLSGADLDLVSDAEGITGLITEVTIRVRPAAETAVVAGQFASAAELGAALKAVAESSLPLWSVSFVNPKMAELKNRTPEKVLHDVPHPEHVQLPEAYLALFACDAADRETVEPAVAALVVKAGGKVLGRKVAEHEWEDRFNLLKVKRLGPSLVPAEVVIPLDGLAGALADVEAKISQPMVVEGVLARRGAGDSTKPAEPIEYDAVLLGFIPHDERRIAFNFAYAAAVSVLKIAKAHGGRAYSTGLYFAREADAVLGKDRAERLRAFKASVDPKRLMNPGKVIEGGAVAGLLSLAQRFEGLIRPFANAAKAPVGERIPDHEVKGLPGDVAWYAYACSQCGYCVDDCTQFSVRGWESQSPRGKWYFLRMVQEGKARWDQRWIDSFLVCTTCERCDVNCPLGLPVEPSWMKMRGRKIHEEKGLTIPIFEMMGAALASEGNIWAGYRKHRAKWFPQDLWQKHGPEHRAKNVYFAGCTASYTEPDIGIGAVRLLDEAGVDFTYLGEKENCCATPMLVAGKWDLFVETMRKNVEAVKAAGADTVTTSCPACDMMWRKVYPEWCAKLGIPYDVKVKHYSELVVERIKAGEFAFPAPKAGKAPVKVTWHDSCHIGRASGVYEPPRELIKATGAELIEMAHNRQDALCCGSVLTLVKEPRVAHDIGKLKLEDADATGAEKLLALCPCCQFQMRVSKEKRGARVEVEDLAHFACSALGYELPDPNPEVQYLWALFEAFIRLMTPGGFAELMGTMWPELVDAMPFGMGALMRAMGKLPGPLGDVAFGAMKPMFPVLFPKLLPTMMPKVLPTMLDRVAARIPMPQYMQEQMPDLMPKVVDSLMPKMLPDVVPLVTDPLVNYLRGRGT